MKLKNIFISLLAATALVACSDDDASWNSGAATVEMGQSEISLRENAGLFNVPIVVSGEQNDYIRVTVEVAETGEHPAMEDVHYYVTSKSIVIPADAASGNIEISAVNDNDINDARTFTVTIVSAEGASIGQQASTAVELRDEDSDFYEKLKGSWKMNCTTNAGPATWNVSITGASENEDGYGEILYINGIMGYDWVSLPMSYSFDVATNTGSVSLLLGQMMAEGVGFTDGNYDVWSGSVDGNSMVVEGGIPGTWNEDFTEITFEAGIQLWGFISPVGSGLAGLDGNAWFYASDFVLTK